MSGVDFEKTRVELIDFLSLSNDFKAFLGKRGLFSE